MLTYISNNRPIPEYFFVTSVRHLANPEGQPICGLRITRPFSAMLPDSESRYIECKRCATHG